METKIEGELEGKISQNKVLHFYMGIASLAMVQTGNIKSEEDVKEAALA